MAILRSLRLKFESLLRRERATRELDDELQLHLDELTSENVARGLSPAEARYAAMKSFGNRTLTSEDARATWGWSWLDPLAQDLRFALRQLAGTPGFTTTAILTLAFGIGANAAIFTLVHAVLLKTLPVTDPETLIRLGNSRDCCVGTGTSDSGAYSYFTTANYEAIRQNVPEFADLAAMQAGFTYRPITARRDGSREAARSVMGEFVSGNYFRTFGLRPRAGRLFVDDDNAEGASAVAVISDASWRRDYGADPSIVGSAFWVNTKPVTVVGVAPAGFYGDRLTSTPPEFYLPYESMTALANVTYIHDADVKWLYMIGRVKPGVALPALQQRVGAVLKHSLGESKLFSSEENRKRLDRVHVVLTPGGAGIQSFQQEYASNLRLLLAASGLVLLTACANIANLVLVRGTRRRLELSVRTALGAARSRLVRQLLTESVVLALLGGVAGLVVAYAGTMALLSLAFPGAQNVPIQAHPSLAVLAFAFGLSLLTGCLFGLAPAWIAAQAEPAALRSGSRGSIAGASLLQRGLVILQTALSVVLLVGAGLFAQSLHKQEAMDLKLDPTNRYIVHINPQAAGYSTTQVEALYRTIEERFHSLFGIQKVGIATYTAMEDNNWGTGVQIQGEPESRNGGASFVKVNAEYFDSVGTRVVMGRGIAPQDAPGAPNVAVVNQAFVKSFFKPGTNPIGHHFGGGRDSAGDFEIVGVVEDTVYQSVRWDNHTMYFCPMLQRPGSDKGSIAGDSSLYAGAIVLQTRAPVAQMEQLARQTLAEINPNLAVVRFQTFDQQIADQFTDDRLVARLTALFGVLALLLATLGLYGLTAYTVARRRSEIGIRMALGARRADVVAMVLRGALSPTVVGLAIGVPLALLCVRFVASQLYEIKSANPAILLVAVCSLLVASAIAGLIPARRAALSDPARILRTD